jgi:hypothetical protein
VIAGVRILTLLQLGSELRLIDFDDELAGGTTPIERTIVPYRKEAIRLVSIVHDAKSKKRRYR